jgi:hypothetical protein
MMRMAMMEVQSAHLPFRVAVSPTEVNLTRTRHPRFQPSNANLFIDAAQTLS